MRIARLATFVATFVLCSAAVAALSIPNPSIDGLTGSFRTNLREIAQEGPQTSALDAADAAMGTEQKSFSKELKKVAGALKKLDKEFGDDPAYNEQADFLVQQLQLVVGLQLGNTANLALADDVVKGNPLRFAKLIQRNGKIADTINLGNESSKISRAKTRSKQIKLLAKAAKQWEKTIKRFGKNNPDL